MSPLFSVSHDNGESHRCGQRSRISHKFEDPSDHEGLPAEGGARLPEGPRRAAESARAPDPEEAFEQHFAPLRRRQRRGRGGLADLPVPTEAPEDRQQPEEGGSTIDAGRVVAVRVAGRVGWHLLQKVTGLHERMGGWANKMASIF